MPVGSMGGVALCPCRHVAPLCVLLALQVTAAVVVGRPAGITLLRVADCAAAAQEAPGARRGPSAVHAHHPEVVEARAGPGASPGGVHGREQGRGREVFWKNGPLDTDKASSSCGVPVLTSDSYRYRAGSWNNQPHKHHLHQRLIHTYWPVATL